METIADLNNLAVTCMNDNKLKDAITILVQALELTRNQFCHDDAGSPSLVDGTTVLYPQSLTGSTTSHEEAPQGQMALLPSMQSPHGVLGSVNMLHGNIRHGNHGRQQPFQNSSATKYQKPFRIFQEMDGCTTLSILTTAATLMSNSESRTTFVIQCSAIVIFNCALCHDRLSQSPTLSTPRKQALRDKAMVLYEKVIDLYFETSSHGRLEEVNVIHSFMVSNGPSQLPGKIKSAQQDIMVMAAINNLVQFHHESSQESNYYSQLMMVLFQQIQCTDYGSTEIQRQVDSQARVFVSNTLLQSWTMTLARAAAAA